MVSFCAVAGAATAQIRGTVRDATNTEPIVGASVTSGKTGAITDDDGLFELPTAKIGDKIEVRHIGYRDYTGIIRSANTDIILEPSAGQLSEVVVRGLTEEAGAVKKVKENVMPVTVLTGKQIENRASDLNELIAKQTGVQIRQTGGLGSEARISVRGLEGQRVQVFVDGRPLNTPDGSLGINDLPVQLIERIEIYKGTMPAWLGGDGLGSAVNVVLQHRDVSYIDANITYQSFNTLMTVLAAKKSFDDKGVEIGLGVFTKNSSNNYDMELPTQPGKFVKRDHDAFSSLMLGGSISFTKLGFDKLELEGVWMQQKKEIQGTQRNIQHAHSLGRTTAVVLNAEKKLLEDRLFIKYAGTLAYINPNFTDTSSYSYDWDGNRFPSIRGKGELGIGPNLSVIKNIEQRQQINLNYELSETFTINLNNRIRNARFDPKDDVGNEHAGKNLYNHPGSLFNSTTGLTLETRMAEDKWLFSTALKHYYSTAQGYNTNILIDKDPEKVNNVTNRFGYNAGFRYRFNTALIAKGSYEKAVRLPLNSEVFGDGGLITPSISLKPEHANNYTAGIIYDKTDAQDKRLQVESNAFYMLVDDMIQLAGAGGLTTGYVNYAKVDIIGADAEFRYDLTKNFYLNANITWQKLRDVNKYIPGSNQVPNPTYGLQIPYVPELFSNLLLEYGTDNLLTKNSRTRLMYEGTWVKKYNYAFNMSIYDDFIIPGYVAHNLILEQSFRNKQYVITGEVHNITNERIINSWNMPLPGRSFRIKLRYLLFENKK